MVELVEAPTVKKQLRSAELVPAKAAVKRWLMLPARKMQQRPSCSR
ncbi:hypothetical protein HaLaN_20839, partial [Haematococcus lacustris]